MRDIIINNLKGIVIHFIITGIFIIINAKSYGYYVTTEHFRGVLVFIIFPALIYIFSGFFFLKTVKGKFTCLVSNCIVSFIILVIWIWNLISIIQAEIPQPNDYFGNPKQLGFILTYWDTYETYNFPFAKLFGHLGGDIIKDIRLEYSIYAISIFLPSLFLYIGLVLKKILKRHEACQSSE